MTQYQFACEDDLLDRLSSQPHGVVYLTGSAVTAASRRGERGVPRVEEVIEQIRQSYASPWSRSRFEKAIAENPTCRYQAAFRHLIVTRGQDVANAIVRRCVLQARDPSLGSRLIQPGTLASAQHYRELEDDIAGWYLPPAVEALGRLLARVPPKERPTVLTSNFDPLLTVSIRRAGGHVFTTALHDDGGFTAISGQGTLVVHFHGDWFRSDTLHTSIQLGRERPRLAASLEQLLASRTLVVLGYGGWDDIFMRSLAHVLRGEFAPIQILWAFYSADEARITSESADLLEKLGPGIERERVILYKGINVHTFLPRLVQALVVDSMESPAMESPAMGSPVMESPATESPAPELPATESSNHSPLIHRGGADPEPDVPPHVPADADRTHALWTRSLLVLMLILVSGMAIWTMLDLENSPPVSPPKQVAEVPAALVPDRGEPAAETRAVATPPGMIRIAGAPFRMGLATADELYNACVAQFGGKCPQALFDRSRAAYDLGETMLEPFFLDRFEISQQAFVHWLNRQSNERAITVKGNMVWSTDVPPVLLLHLPLGIKAQEGIFRIGQPDEADRPIVFVTWDAAERYCRAQGKRLPSPAEWELAARGIARRRMVCGDCTPKCADIVFGRDAFEAMTGSCNGEPSGPQPSDVGPMDVTPEGARHLAGNVSEWVNTESPLIDPQAPCPGGTEPRCRMFKGGSWHDPLFLTSPALFSRAPAGTFRDYLGFRCARPIET